MVQDSQFNTRSAPMDTGQELQPGNLFQFSSSLGLTRGSTNSLYVWGSLRAKRGNLTTKTMRNSYSVKNPVSKSVFKHRLFL